MAEVLDDSLNDGKGRPRPALFRALGYDEPPPRIRVGGHSFERIRIFKHDSWAATALYQSGETILVCKFNRRQSIFGIPMSWLGRALARREARFYATLADLANVPLGCGPIEVDGEIAPNAVGHLFVDGRPLKESDRLPPRFFAELRKTLAVVHQRGIAYMDLHKRENIILGRDGRGYLIDFQVSFSLSKRVRNTPLGALLAAFQQADLYHLTKHELRLGSGPAGEAERRLDESRPAWIRAHRMIAEPLRNLRRRFLVLLGIRKGLGKAQSEHFTEDGLITEERRAA